jgi:hypothetical protein
VKFPEWLLLIVKSGGNVMSVVSDSVLFAALWSKVVLEMEAELTTLADTLEASVTVRVKDVLVPLFSPVAREQVTSCPTALQLQPELTDE